MEFNAVLNNVALFGLGKKVQLLSVFMFRGDLIQLAREMKVSRTFISQILNQNEKRYQSRRVEMALFKLAYENSLKDDMLKEAFVKLFLGDK